ncbi:MAG: hypothetical protein SNG38_02615 [Rikenellaceae bacterium]
MKKSTNLLIGKWKFVKTEKYNGFEWKSTDHVNELAWEFFPQYFGQNGVIGNIIETTPSSSVSLDYKYSAIDNLLRIDVYKNSQTRILDEIDIYEIRPLYHEVVTVNNKQLDGLIIRLSLINQINSPLLYLRYTLQKIL